MIRFKIYAFKITKLLLDKIITIIMIIIIYNDNKVCSH